MSNILWLASWYPDELSPYNGDFVQRHAVAVAQQVPITVIYMAQHGPEVEMPVSKTITRTTGNLTEITVYFKYRPTGLALADKLLYNWKYFYHYRRFLRSYLAEHGKPALVHLHIPMKAGRMAYWLKQEFSIPYIVSEHSSAYSDEVPDHYANRSAYYRRWVKAIFEQATAVTTVSQKVAGLLQGLFNIKKIHLVPNVADTRFFHYKPFDLPRFRFLHASTMDHPKNMEGILNTLHRLKAVRQDWECLMLGWDNPSLRELAGRLGLNDHVQWKGVVPYTEVAAYMQQSSALLMFSRYENLPCVVLEALCCGLPVISSRVGGIPEVVDSSNGLLVEAGNEGQLLQALLQFMETSGRYDRAGMAQAAQHEFSYEAVGRQFAELYRDLSQ
jgi:glycosyltransferase involved in cell wall biosynthesis